MDRKIRPGPPFQNHSPFQSPPQNPSQNPSQNADPNSHPDKWSWGSGWGSGWGTGLKPSFGSMEWFEKERERAERRMEALKREVEHDPYGVLFGRRLMGPGSKSGMGMGMGMGQLWKDLFGDGAEAERATRPTPERKTAGQDVGGTSGRVKTGESTEQATTGDIFDGSRTPRADLEFDPVAGRMVPKTKERGDFDPITGRMTPKGYLSPIERDSDSGFHGPEQVTSGLEQAAEQEANMASEQEADVQAKSEQGKPEQGNVQEANLQETSVQEENVQPKKASKSKLKIHDSTQQAEPILVPEDQELDLLRASDIRASYPRVSKKDMDQPAMDQKLNSIEERVSGLAGDTAVLQSQVQDAAQQAAEQAAVQDTVATEQPMPEQTYSVLAYDPSTQQVTRANTASSLTSETSHPKDILPRLNHPAKFLSHFDQMHREGYEIVSGGGDILIFRSRGPTSAHQLPREAEEIADPLVLEHMAASMPKQDAADALPAGGKQTPKRGFRDALRRMAFAGTATAATCYAIGVVTEYFRTGGPDGRGMDGFTAFESERRAMK